MMAAASVIGAVACVMDLLAKESYYAQSIYKPSL